VSAFDQDAQEWQHGLGGSALFRILVQRDYGFAQVGPDGQPKRPSERYGLYREQKFNPETFRVEDPATGETGTVVLGETDTSDPATLEEFLTYGIRKFPAKHYWVIISGHGDSWNGLAFDATSGAGKRLPLAGLVGALEAGAEVIRTEIRAKPGLGGAGTSPRIDVVQFDVCRLGAIEAASALGGAVDFMVASQELMPDAGHPYNALRYIAQDHPGSQPATVVKAVVTDYVRAYVEGVSTEDKAYVGTSVTSVGLNLQKLRPLLDALARLRQAIVDERPAGFDCAEVLALGRQAIERAGGRATVTSQASTDLIALLETLADPARQDAEQPLAPRVSAEVGDAAQAALDVIGRPHLWTPDEPWGAQLQYGGQYRKLVSFNSEGPFVVEAHRVEPETARRAGGVSVLWGDPYGLLLKENGVSAMDRYRALPWDQDVQWTATLAACIAQDPSP
jgi:hypothetical protein